MTRWRGDGNLLDRFRYRLEFLTRVFDPLKSPPFVARNESLGKEAVRRVVEELREKRTADLRYHQLDITNEDSCRSFADHLRKEHGGLDVLVNNAGYSGSEEEAELTIGINYYGTKRISEHLMPLMRSGGRYGFLFDLNIGDP